MYGKHLRSINYCLTEASAELKDSEAPSYPSVCKRLDPFDPLWASKDTR